MSAALCCVCFYLLQSLFSYFRHSSRKKKKILRLSLLRYQQIKLLIKELTSQNYLKIKILIEGLKASEALNHCYVLKH